jgi:hypothetical protein
MYSFALKIVDKVVYWRENSSVQARAGHEELANIRSRPIEPVPALFWIVVNTSVSLDS